MKRLKVHPSGQFLMWDDGSPFFCLADTAWELFHRLDREETEKYFNTRAKQGFNAVQAVALSEFDGVTVPNKYCRLPLKFTDGIPDPTLPDTDGGYDYWEHMEYAVKLAADRDIFIILLPTWGDKFNKLWGKGPEIFTPENAYIYGKQIAERFKKYWNIIWMLGGDRPLDTPLHKKITDEMGRGISETDPDHLITFHPPGETSSADFVSKKTYIEFNTVQSGHGLGGWESYLLLRRTKELEPAKPFMDSEPRYEDHPACFKPEHGCYWNAQDVRNNAYWDMCEGVCGHTYGNHCIWGFNDSAGDYFPFVWQDALEHEAANQIGFLKQLRLSRPFFEFRPAPELVCDDAAVGAHIAAGRGNDYAYIYTPQGQPIRANLELLGGKIIRSSWFDPRTGKESVFKLFPPKQVLFVPPSFGDDWLLILEIAEK